MRPVFRGGYAPGGGWFLEGPGEPSSLPRRCDMIQGSASEGVSEDLGGGSVSKGPGGERERAGWRVLGEELKLRAGKERGKENVCLIK